MKQKLLEMIQIIVWLYTDDFFFGFTKTKMGPKTSAFKTELL